MSLTKFCAVYKLHSKRKQRRLVLVLVLVLTIIELELELELAASVCVYCVNCTKFGQLILRIIIKIDATRCQIIRLKCTKIVFGWGSTPDPAGELTALPQTP